MNSMKDKYLKLPPENRLAVGLMLVFGLVMAVFASSLYPQLLASSNLLSAAAYGFPILLAAASFASALLLSLKSSQRRRKVVHWQHLPGGTGRSLPFKRIQPDRVCAHPQPDARGVLPDASQPAGQICQYGGHVGRNGNPPD